MPERFICEALRERDVLINELAILSVLLLWLTLLALLGKASSMNPGEGEGEGDIDCWGEYCVELEDVSKLGRVYDRVREGRAAFVEFMRRRPGLLDVMTESETGWGGARANDSKWRNGYRHFFVMNVGEEGREFPLLLTNPSSNEYPASRFVACRTDLRHNPLSCRLIG